MHLKIQHIFKMRLRLIAKCTETTPKKHGGNCTLAPPPLLATIVTIIGIIYKFFIKHVSKMTENQGNCQRS